MEKDEIEYSIKQSMQCEFDVSELKRKVEIIKTAKLSGYDELAQVMQDETELEYNIKIN